MMKRIKKFFALLLALALTVGALPVSAAAADTGFVDVPEGAYYADAVEWAVDKQITNGTGKDTFSPAKTVTRAEAVTFLWRAAGCPSSNVAASGFSDVTNQDAYYYDAVLWAVENGITNGAGGGRFKPTGTLAYDQILTFLYRFDGGKITGNDWSAAAVSWARNNGLTDGLTFTAKASCPRADVVYCLWKQLANAGGQNPEQPVLTNEAGASLTIITSFLDRKAAIDISDFGLEFSQAEQLALEIADVNGANPYGISRISASERDGRLAIYYDGTTVSGATVANNDWRYISEAAQAEADRVVDSLITSGMSDYEVVKTLHDYLVTHCEYDYRVDIGNMPFVSHQAEGALLNGIAVCSGYAKAYEAMLDAADIPCVTITGYAGGYHAWNLVQVDGLWYHVDATWDDPTNQDDDCISYTYFLKSDKVMVSGRHRNWEAVYNCTSTKYDEKLMDSTNQAVADERQQQINAIVAFCAPAMKNIPTWTQAELRTLSDQQLADALYYVIDLSGAGFDVYTLYLYGQAAADILCAQYPGFAYGSCYHTKMTMEFLQTDVAQEMKRRQEIAQAEAEQQAEAERAEAEQQAAQNAASAVAIQKILEQAILNAACETYDITLTGYTDEAIQLACKNMTTEGYSFSGYTYRKPLYTSDFTVSAKSGGIVHISNSKWGQAELQRYVDQVEEAIRQGQARVALEPGNYPDKNETYYATRAIRQVAAEGYSFDGFTAGVDYMLGSSGTDSVSRVTSAHIDYPFLADMTEEEAMDYLIQQIRVAIQRGDTRVYLPTDFGDNDYSTLPSKACSMVKEETGYSIRVASSGGGDCTVVISRPGEK